MKIAILGKGNVGRALGGRWAQAEHEVTFGVRELGKGPEVAGTSELSVGAAAAWAEVVVLAVPWDAVKATLAACGDLQGKLVLDCTNPLLPGLAGLELGHTTSGGELVASLAPGVPVFKVFNSTGAENMSHPVIDGHRAVMFYCGDDAKRRAQVHQLVTDVGFEAIDAGPLSSARLLEPLAMLWISLAFKQGLGRSFAFGLLRRES